MAGKGGDTSSALGLLALRLGAAGMLIYAHGWHKLTHFTEMSQHFADPLHVGRQASLAMAVFAEFVCSALVALGFMTRLVVIPLLIQFGVIIFIVRGADPVVERELELLYAVAFIAIGLLGPGRFSVDGASGRA